MADKTIRQCIIQKWPDFTGFGFNLHAEKAKAGQFIGKVDVDSPASSAGLREGDRIVEVDGVNIGNENHQQVVSRIKAGGNTTSLLVVDKETDLYYKELKVVITGSLPNVERIEGPPSRTISVTNSTSDDLKNGAKEAAIPAAAPLAAAPLAAAPCNEDSNDHQESHTVETGTAVSQTEEKDTAAEDSAVAAVAAAVADNDDEEISKPDFVGETDPTKGLTAKQLREQLKNKKRDVRSISLPLQQKYDMLERL